MIRQASVFACAACLLIATPAMSQAAAAVPPLRTAGAADLAAGKRGRPGPVIIEEYDATCVVPPGWRAELDTGGNIVMEMG